MRKLSIAFILCTLLIAGMAWVNAPAYAQPNNNDAIIDTIDPDDVQGPAMAHEHKRVVSGRDRGFLESIRDLFTGSQEVKRERVGHKPHPNLVNAVKCQQAEHAYYQAAAACPSPYTLQCVEETLDKCGPFEEFCETTPEMIIGSPCDIWLFRHRTFRSKNEELETDVEEDQLPELTP